jgi:hypothetical protein
MSDNQKAVTGQRESMAPVQLAEEIVRVVGDADDSTARAALDIAGILLQHRKESEIAFLSEASG